MSFQHQRESDVKFHSKVKTYPGGMVEILAANRPIFGPSGWEQSDKWDSEKRKPRDGSGDVDRAKRRAAAKIRDIALCNAFRYFVTLTLSAEQVNRYEIGPVLAKMRTWLDNRVRRCGLKYVLIPEYHKDGAIHFHGFFNDALEVVDSGAVKIPGQKRPKKPRSSAELDNLLENGAVKLYNLPDWALGFSVAMPLYGDYDAAIAYVCKYVTKAGQKIGGRWYYSGGALALPEVSYADASADELEATGAYAFDIPAAGLRLAIWRGEGNNTVGDS